MKSELIKTDKFSFITFENIFDEEELNKIWIEAVFLCDPLRIRDEKRAMAARERDGTSKKKGKGIFLDEIYREREISSYLSFYKKPFNVNAKTLAEYSKQDFIFELFFLTNYDNTLLNYFSDNDYYNPHGDIACFTYVFWLYQEPKAFTGGDFCFPDAGCTISIASNSGVLFPSWANHSVTPLSFHGERKEYDGRFSFTTFFLLDKNVTPR